MFSVNRIVALLTPVFGAAAAVGTAYVAKHFPGLPAIPASDVVALEITGATAAVGAALKWLHGYQGFERLEHEAELAVKYVESQEKINGVSLPSEGDAIANRTFDNLHDQLTEARANADRAAQAQASAEHKAGVALTQLAHVRRLIGDPNLILPDAPEAMPQSEVQPAVEPAVPDAVEQTPSQSASAAPVPAIPEQSQAV